MDSKTRKHITIRIRVKVTNDLMNIYDCIDVHLENNELSRQNNNLRIQNTHSRFGDTSLNLAFPAASSSSDLIPRKFQNLQSPTFSPYHNIRN